MRNFGINLLATTQTVIGKQSYTIEQWSDRSQNARGHMVDTYAAAESRSASVQPVEAKEINLSGLEMNQVYIKIYDVELINILSRTENPPRITWDGYYWQPLAPRSNWNQQGGWNKVYCVRQEAAS